MTRTLMILGALVLFPLAAGRGDGPKGAEGRGQDAPAVIRSAGSGRWSEPWPYLLLARGRARLRAPAGVGRKPVGGPSAAQVLQQA